MYFIVGFEFYYSINWPIIFISLSVSNATSERSFSTLRRIKTCLSQQQGKTDIEIEPNVVLDKFASSGNHRLLI